MADPAAASRLLHHARREARFTLLVWALAFVWVVGYCYLFGYQHAADSWPVQAGLVPPTAPADFRQIAGLPEWVCFGIIAPWLLCTFITLAFALFAMTEDELGAEAAEGPVDGH